MRLKELHIHFQKTLAALYDREEVNNFFFMLCQAFVNVTRVQLALRPDLEVTEQDEQRFREALSSLERETPIQYIIGEAHFYDLLFEVNEHTLIPRPETEELVDWIKSDLQDIGLQKPKIVDIGTGTGCIAISLAHLFSDALVTAIDISAGALETAYRNAEKNKVKVSFIQKDILAVAPNDADLGKYDVVVSNPPYVRELEKQEIKNNVLLYEPDTALFVSDDNPLIFYNKISDFAFEHLQPGGILYFEINQYLAEETKLLVASKGFKEVSLRKDIYGNYRMLKAIKK
ncbi:peptide chain release factor N(5)-glutamine methyltransferase [Neptunitalea lumnitzerae]|nr:peptide chain release factor N(5)-glutamine methyltransferase [Neptunitalea sp. Y10]